MKYLQAASEAFLCKRIPDNWDDLDEDSQNDFLRTYAWAPLAHNSPDELFDLIDSHCVTISALFKWTKIKDELPPPNQLVLLKQKTGYGNEITVIGQYVTKHTLEYSGDDEHFDYDEKTDTCYCPEGYYEQQANWSEYNFIYIHDEIIAWMPLPE